MVLPAKVVDPQRRFAYLPALAVHHIVRDGWSLGVLWQDLADAYARRRQPPLPVRYHDFARWQRALLASPVLDEQVAYWSRHLSVLPRSTCPPTGPLQA